MFGGRKDLGKSEEKHYVYLFFWSFLDMHQYCTCMHQIMQSFNILLSHDLGM